MVITNHEMKAGRYLKLAKGRKVFSKMTETWSADGIVMIGTMTRAYEINAKGRDCVTLGKSGSLYLQNGKSRNCIDFCTFGFYA
jgi:hypothetical protein